MRLLPLDRLDRYAIRSLAGPFALALAALLLATLLERLLRLFDLAASTGVALSAVASMAANLVPHYLGLALPMAFTAAIFAATARMGDDNELDVMLSAGRSIGRVAAPYFMLGVLLSVFNLYLFGQLQPITRYAYHVLVDQAAKTTWDARLEETRFIATDHGFSFTADSIADDGRMTGVFIQRHAPQGTEVTTAANGTLAPAPKGPGQVLRLDKGVILSEGDDGTFSVTRFQNGYVVDLPPALQPYRARGADVNEQTFPELRTSMDLPAERTETAAEFHGRLARSLLPPLLPLFALPLGMASKRGKRTPGVIFAALALLALHHSLQFGESLAANGHAPAALALWLPYGVFAVIGSWIFFGSLAWPGDNPVTRAVNSIEHVIDRVLDRVVPRRRRALREAKAA